MVIFHSYVSLPEGILKDMNIQSYSRIFPKNGWFIGVMPLGMWTQIILPVFFVWRIDSSWNRKNQMFVANVVFRVNSWHPSNTFKHNVYPTNIVTLTRHMIFLDALLQWWILGVENNLSKTGLNVNLWTKPITIQSKLMGYVMNPIHNYFILSRPEFNIYIYDYICILFPCWSVKKNDP